jgi:galactokinase
MIFKSAPILSALSPGRVNLIGEHVDYAGGLVLPLAINRGTTVAATPAPSGTGTVITSRAKGHALSLPLGDAWSRRTAHAERWASNPLGTLGLLREAGVALPDLHLDIGSDLPLGGGLSSSASLMVATAVAALAAVGVDPEAFGCLRLAKLCRRAETEWAGVPCGLMDPAIAALGRAGHAMLLDCRDESFEFVPMPAGIEVVVFDSGVRHRLADGGYAARRNAVEESERSVAAAGGGSLRELSERGDGEAFLASLGLGDATLRRGRHVVCEIARVRQALEAMRRDGPGDRAARHDPLRGARLAARRLRGLGRRARHARRRRGRGGGDRGAAHRGGLRRVRDRPR